MKRSMYFCAILVGLVASIPCVAEEAVSSVDANARMLVKGLKLLELREDSATSELGVYTAYEAAQELEAEIVQMYREIRAAELSLIQRQTLQRSLESTLTPLSERAKVDEALLTNPAKDAETVKQYQEELSVVIRETDAIVAAPDGGCRLARALTLLFLQLTRERIQRIHLQLWRGPPLLRPGHCETNEAPPRGWR